jgi:hypothetical protein
MHFWLLGAMPLCGVSDIPRTDFPCEVKAAVHGADQIMINYSALGESGRSEVPIWCWREDPSRLLCDIRSKLNVILASDLE